MLYQPVSQWHSLHFELLIELVAQKFTELWRFKNFAYFLTWWPSSMTYLFVNVTYWNCSPIPYVDQVWWWYVKAFMSYAWQNWQTNRQTNRQTNILAKNCKFWQVIRHIGHIHLTTVDVYDFLFRNVISSSWYAVRKCDQLLHITLKNTSHLLLAKCFHISLLAKIYNFWQVCSFVGLSVC